MTKQDIKIKVNEALGRFSSVPMGESTQEDDEESRRKPNDNNKKPAEGGKKDYTDIRRAFEKLGGPSMVDVMQLTGTPDDEKGINRSLFRKKVKQIKNKDTGSYYQFDDKELPQVRAALDIQK